MYQTYLFDLDGTLTDPWEGITNSILYAVERLKAGPVERRELVSFIGPPLHQSFKMRFGFDDATAFKAVEIYREYFSVKGYAENRVYDGIDVVLKTLKQSGKRLIVATSKPEVYAIKILKEFKLFDYFDYVAGATMDSSRVEKADVIAYAISSCEITDKGSAVMVGDRKHDVFGARKNGLQSIGVLYGYGSLEELTSAQATHIAPTVQDILKI